MSISDTIPAKIIMRGTSTLSLNDRFSKYSGEDDSENYRDYTRAEKAFAVKEKRFTQQTVNRPTFPKEVLFEANNVNARHRLGVKARLGNRSRSYSNGFYDADDVDDDVVDEELDGYIAKNQFRSDWFQPRNFNRSPYRRYDGYSNAGRWNHNGYLQQPRRPNWSGNRYRVEQRYRGGYYERRRFPVYGSYRGGRGRNNYRGGSRRGGNFGMFRRRFQKPKISKEELDKDLDAYLAQSTGKDFEMDQLLGVL